MSVNCSGRPGIFGSPVLQNYDTGTCLYFVDVHAHCNICNEQSTNAFDNLLLGTEKH